MAKNVWFYTNDNAKNGHVFYDKIKVRGMDREEWIGRNKSK
ncbi:MAG: hypothetical protein RR393_08525 [Bacteroidales bacterium]